MAAGLAASFILMVALRPLLPIDETRYLDVAWEMWQSGDLFHLTRNFDLYTHKPPLLFWLINLVWLVTGIHEFAARLVGPAFALATVIAAARLARRLWPEDGGIAVRTAAVMAGFTIYLVYGSATMFDTMLSLATVLGAGLLWRIGSGAREWRIWAGFGAVLAFGIYAKGPVIFVHLLPLLLSMPLWAARPPRLAEAGRGVALALGIGVALVAVWLVPALAGGTAAYREELLWTQSAARVAGGMAHDRPVWFLAALLPILLFPWGWSWRIWPGLVAAVRAEPAARMLAIWALSGLVLFSVISGKQAHYLVPEFAAVAMLMARALGQAGQAGRGGSAAFLVPLGLGVFALAFAAGLIPARGDLSLLAPVAGVAGFGLFCLVLAGLALRLGAVPAHLATGLGLTLALHLLIATTGLHAAYNSAPVVARLEAAEQGGLAVIGMPYNAEFNFAGRMTAPVATPADAAALKGWAATHPAGLVFGPVGKVPVTAPPIGQEEFNGIRYGFWPAAGVALSVRE